MRNARTVAGVRLAAARTAMVEVREHLQRVADDGVRFLAFDVGEEADTTRLVFELRIVESLFFRRPDSLMSFIILPDRLRSSCVHHCVE